MRQTFSKPNRSSNAGSTVPKANDDATRGEHGRVLTRCLQHDSQDCDYGRDSNGVLASIPVAPPSRDGTSDALPDIDGSGVESESCRGEREVVSVAGEDVQPRHHATIVS